MTDPTFLARVCWNDRSWSEPAGVAADAESNSSAAEFGFGSEEWIFNVSRCLDDWHYGYLTPVMRSRRKLLKEGRTVLNIRLWTKDPDRNRWYVGEIRHCEVITDKQGAHAVREYKRRGWLKEMASQLDALHLNGINVASPPQPDWVFNIRFRPTDAELYDPFYKVPRDHAVYKTSRYALVLATERHIQEWPPRGPSKTLRPVDPLERRAIAATVMTREHNVLQNHLCQLLRGRFGEDVVPLEERWIDIQCRDGARTHLIEVKSDPRAKTAIREAIGQLLEYAYFPPMEEKTAPVLHVAAPGPCTDEVRRYLATIKQQCGLVVKYHQLTRETTDFDLRPD